MSITAIINQITRKSIIIGRKTKSINPFFCNNKKNSHRQDPIAFINLIFKILYKCHDKDH